MKDSRLLSAMIILLTAFLLSSGIALLNYFAGNSSIIAYIFSSIPLIISIFYFGASIHLSSIENRHCAELTEEFGNKITERMSYINILITRGKDALKTFHQKSNLELNIINESTHTQVLMLRRIVNALEERQDKLVELSRTMNLKEAEELSFSPIEMPDSALYSVGRSKIPALSHDQWEDSLNTLINVIDSKKRAA